MVSYSKNSRLLRALTNIHIFSDPVCNHYTCGYDHDDCGQCAPGCSHDMLSNKICDQACYNATCAFDNKDCFANATVGRRLHAEMIEETTLNNARELDDDAYGEPDGKTLPPICQATCLPQHIGDKYCDALLCGRECDFDDCRKYQTVETCNANSCPSYMRSDSVCNAPCATRSCNFDGGRCPVLCPGSKCGDLISSKTCQAGCNTDTCRFQINTCYNQKFAPCGAPCKTSMLGNGICNAECNKLACKWDGGDCPSRPFCPNFLGPDYAICVSQCNKPLFKFQDGLCDNSCVNAQCRAEMLGDGVCQ